MPYRDIIFCDFDGTITETDTLEGFIQQFTEEDIRTVGKRMQSSGYSVKRGITELMGSIRSEDYRKKTDYFRHLPFREGFGDFLDYAKAVQIPVVILSGGIRDMVSLALAPYRDKIADLWAGQVDLTKEYVRFYSDYESETEVVSKVSIMRRYACDHAIAVGDSYTDMEMACEAQIVFARDRLAAAMEKSGKNYFTFASFYDIISALQNVRGGLRNEGNRG